MLASLLVLFSVKPDNNVPALYCQEETCAYRNSTDTLILYGSYASYGVLILSLIPCKIVGLELFGVLQLAYFSLGSVDEINVLLSPLMGMGYLNGYKFHIAKSKYTLDVLPSRL